MAAGGAWHPELVAGAGADVAADVEPVGVEDGCRFYGGGRLMDRPGLIGCAICAKPVWDFEYDVQEEMCLACYVKFGDE